MITFLALIAGVYAAGSLALFIGMRAAPEGYEDESGFNIVWCNNTPDVADVACVWEFSAQAA
jgi:hypothetical protein